MSTTIGLDVFNYIIELCFLFDIVMNFLTEYKDPETYGTVRSISKISKRYAFKGSFVIDFIGIIPFQYILGGN